MVYLVVGLIAGVIAHYFYPIQAEYNIWLIGYVSGVLAMCLSDAITNTMKED